MVSWIYSQKDFDPYQHKAADWLYEHDAALAFMPVGAGKTAVSITALRALVEDDLIDHALVVAPKRVASMVWPEELEKWEDGHALKRRFITGEPNSWPMGSWRRARTLWGQRMHAERRLAKLRVKPGVKAKQITDLEVLVRELKDMEKGAAAALFVEEPLMVTSYENIPWLCEHFDFDLPFDLIAMDEGSRASSPKSELFKMLRKASAKVPHMWDLTASPAPEGLHKLWAQVTLLDKGKRWGKSFYKWRDLYFRPIDYYGYKWVPQIGAEERIYADLKGLMFTVDEKSLPKKAEPKHRVINVRLTDEERKVYRKMARDFMVSLGGKEVSAINKGVLSGKLRQLAQGFIYDENKKAVRFHSHKIDALEELVEELQGEPLLIGYAFQEDLRMILERWPDMPYLGQGVSDAKGAKACNDWNAGKLPLFGIHPASGGHGLNLQAGGSHLCWFGMPWSRELYDQLIGRIWRRGQTRLCFIHYIRTIDTADDDVWDAVEGKISFQDALARAVEKIR